MNILLINHYAGSPEMGMEFRPYYFAREWVGMGHHVDIIAADYSHLRIKNPDVGEDFQTEEIEGIRYHWVRAGRYQGNGIKRAFSMFRFVGKLWLHAGKAARGYRPDVVITSSTYPLDTYAGQRIVKKSGAKLIHEVHDMWPVSPMELGGMSRHHPFIVLMQMAEDSFCRRSDTVVSLLPNAKEYLMAHGMAENKFVPIANGIVREEWEKKKPLPEELRKKLEEIKKSCGFLLCFFGSHTRSYAIEYLIEAVKRFRPEEAGAVLVGAGADKEQLQRMSRGAPNVWFMDPVPKVHIPALLEMVDGIYIGAVKNRMLRFGICMNKLFDAMMSGRPILYAVDAPNDYIKEFGCGVSVPPEDTDALAQGIRGLLSMPEGERREMGERGRQAVLANFTYDILAKKFEDILRDGPERWAGGMTAPQKAAIHPAIRTGR